MHAGRRLRAKWDEGQPTFGMWAGIDSSLTAELAAAAGYDYVCVDLQHGMSDERTMVAMFQAIAGAGSTPLARLAWNEPWLIMRALDLGCRRRDRAACRQRRRGDASGPGVQVPAGRKPLRTGRSAPSTWSGSGAPSGPRRRGAVLCDGGDP